MKGARYKTGGWYGESYRHYLAAKGVSTKRNSMKGNLAAKGISTKNFFARRTQRRPPGPVPTDEYIGRELAEEQLTAQERRKLDKLKERRSDLMYRLRRVEPVVPKYRIALQLNQAKNLLRNPNLPADDEERLVRLLNTAMESGADKEIIERILEKLQNPQLTSEERMQLAEQIEEQNRAYEEFEEDPEYAEFRELRKQLRSLDKQIDTMQGFPERQLGIKAGILSDKQVMESPQFKRIIGGGTGLPADPEYFPPDVLKDAIALARERIAVERKLPRGGKIGPFGDIPIPRDVRPQYIKLLEEQQRYGISQPGAKEMRTESTPFEIKRTFTGERLPPSQYKRRTRVRDIVEEAEEKGQQKRAPELPAIPKENVDVAESIIRARKKRERNEEEFSARKQRFFSRKSVDKKAKKLSPAEKLFGYGIIRTAKSVESVKESKLGGFRVK